MKKPGPAHPPERDPRRKHTPDERQRAEEAHPSTPRAHFEDVIRRLVTTAPPKKKG